MHRVTNLELLVSVHLRNWRVTCHFKFRIVFRRTLITAIVNTRSALNAYERQFQRVVLKQVGQASFLLASWSSVWIPVRQRDIFVHVYLGQLQTMEVLPAVNMAVWKFMHSFQPCLCEANLVFLPVLFFTH